MCNFNPLIALLLALSLFPLMRTHPLQLNRLYSTSPQADQCDTNKNLCNRQTHLRLTGRPGLVTKTTDTIYQALPNTFTYDQPVKTQTTKVASPSSLTKDGLITIKTTTTPQADKDLEYMDAFDYDQGESQKLSARPTSSRPQQTHWAELNTQKPATKNNQTALLSHSSLSHLSPIKSTDHQRNELYNSIINTAFNSIYSLKSLVMLNRTTRLATDDELSEPSDASELKLTNQETNRMATSEDIHMLCRLLHKHLEANSSTLSSLSTAPLTTNKPVSSTTTITTTSTTLAPNHKPSSVGASARPKVHDLVEPSGLSVDSHENYLLESVFSYNRTQIKRLEEPIQRAAQRLILNLFNMAAKTNRSFAKTLEEEADYEPDSEESKLLPGSDHDHFRLQLFNDPRLNYPGHFHLVYWLLERIQPSKSFEEESEHRTKVVKTKFRLLDASEANELLNSLDQLYVKRQLEESKLNLLVQLAPFKVSSLQNHSHYIEPNIIDDSLTRPDRDHKSPSAFQLLIDRLSNSSFYDNLHLYLILFILVLVTIILCFAIPMICCKSQLDKARSQTHRQSRLDVRSLTYPDQPIKSSEKTLQLGSDSIWRKLSNTTTTMVKDETELMRHELGSVRIPVQLNRADSQANRPKFEYYSFEDRLEEQHERKHENKDKQSQTSIVTDKRLFNKSVQTNLGDFFVVDEIPIECKNRSEHRSSDTLTKSELVMIREKLQPISIRQQSPPPVVSLIKTELSKIEQRDRNLARYMETNRDKVP